LFISDGLNLVDDFKVPAPGAYINVILINSGNIKVTILISMLEKPLKVA
jgi:hypothetical protein